VPTGSVYHVERSPFFLDTADRRLFALHYRPAGVDRGASPRRAVLLLAPFAEEMNRSRRMMTLQAETLAAHGLEVLVFDYSGTGDSSGEFATARWDDWRADCDGALAWLHSRGAESVDLVAIRLGALLACDISRRHDLGPGRIVLWQPVVSGNNFMTQFLRFRVAASLEADAGRETTKDLRARFAAGETVEIAGYEIAAQLATSIDGLRLVDFAPPPGMQVNWFELSAEGGEIAPASTPVVGAWRDAGIAVNADTQAGEAFWTVQELTLAPRLIAATAAVLGADGTAIRQGGVA
jgi:exosortase A-associated hydrolase 2